MYLATASQNLRVYSTENWCQLYFYEYQNQSSNTDVISYAHWSDDGKYILQVSPSGRTEIYSVTQDGIRCLQCIPEFESTAAAFQKGGHRQIAVGLQSGKIFIWDTKFKNILKAFTDVVSPVKFIDFNSKNTFLAAGLENGDVTIYGLTTNHHVGNISIPSYNADSAVKLNKVSALKFHYELRSILAIASDEGCVLVRDLGNGKNKLYMGDAHKSIVSGIAFSKNNQDIMLSCGYDRKAHIYDIRKQIIPTSITTDYALTSVDINSSNHIALGTTKGQVLIYDFRKITQPLHIISDHKSRISALSFQPEIDRRKRFLALDASLKESFSPKPSSFTSVSQNKECKTPEAVKSYDYIDQFNSPTYVVTSPKREKLDLVNGSKDSFLVNIVGETQGTDHKTSHVMFVDSPEINKSKLLDITNIKTHANKMRKSVSLGEGISDCGTLASTPKLHGKISPINEATPSPILYRNGILEVEDHSKSTDLIVSQNSSGKKGDSVDSVSAVETVKQSSNMMVELGNELKDFITYSIFDVLQQSKSNFMQMIMEQTKNRLHLEDQIAVLATKVQELQHNQSVLIEENKKLSIEVELLRSVRN